MASLVPCCAVCVACKLSGWLVVLCRYLREKDHFERQYKKHLSKRLLANKPPAEGGYNTAGVSPGVLVLAPLLPHVPMSACRQLLSTTSAYHWWSLT